MMPEPHLPRRYVDRHDAGRVLAAELRCLVGRPDIVVVALPTGGVPVASEIAQVLGAPLDIFVVRALPVPEHPEITMGLIASGGLRILDRELIEATAVSSHAVEAATRVAEEDVRRCERAYRNGRRPLSLTRRVVILVDDGIGRGSTLHAAAQAVRTLKPAEVVVAAPVASISGRDDLCALADRVICPLVPPSLRAVADYYDDFTPVSDSEVRALLGLPTEVPQFATTAARR
jgi:putative phosphoribosyl transferase